MAQDLTGNLRIFGQGIVVEDIEDGSDVIKVYPVEHLSLVDGKILDYSDDYNASIPDAQGVERKATTSAKAYLTARWLPLCQSNRMTPPDVTKNETVVIWQFADTDKYYWTTVFREPGIRRKETVCYMYGNLEKPLTTWDKSTSYWIEVSTKKKYIKLHTSRSDGEKYEYDVTIDTSGNEFRVEDSAGNSIVLETSIPCITVTNSDGTFFKLDKKDIEAYAPANMIFEALKNISVKAGGTITVEADEDIISKAIGNVSVEAGKLLTLGAGQGLAITSSGGGGASMESGGPMEIKAAGQLAFSSDASVELKSDTDVLVEAGDTATVYGKSSTKLKSDGGIILEAPSITSTGKHTFAGGTEGDRT